MNSETGKAILNLKKPQPIQAPPLSVHNKNDKICFPLDDRNPGGRKVIEISHTNHRRALTKVVSEIGRVMQAPHAHINNVNGSKNKFG
jgi:hypothetical protein